MCGIAGNLQFWVICWNPSVCGRDLNGLGDLRNDEEVLVGWSYEMEKRRKDGKYARGMMLSKWLHLVSSLMSWLFTSSILCTLWNIELYWTMMILLTMNLVISLIVGLTTWWRSRASSKQARARNSRKREHHRKWWPTNK